MPRKRFIAGAACPACGAQDRIYVLVDEVDRLVSRHCVDCDFEERVDAIGEPGSTTAESASQAEKVPTATVQEWTPVRITGLSNKLPGESGESSE